MNYDGGHENNMTTDGADVASLIEACVAEVSFDAISENKRCCHIAVLHSSPKEMRLSFFFFFCFLNQDMWLRTHCSISCLSAMSLIMTQSF